jgi:hypothetical protein
VISLPPRDRVSCFPHPSVPVLLPTKMERKSINNYSSITGIPSSVTACMPPPILLAIEQKWKENQSTIISQSQESRPQSPVCMRSCPRPLFLLANKNQSPTPSPHATRAVKLWPEPLLGPLSFPAARHAHGARIQSVAQ